MKSGIVLFGFLVACGDSAGTTSNSAIGDAGADADTFASGAELRVGVPDSGRVFVKLDSAAVVDASAAWDIAFEGMDVFTNGGESGSGKASAFGPLDAINFISDAAPTVPFMTSDKAGGAFLDWYAYDGSSHALYSRFHTFGVRDGGKTWKVQILGYYGDRDGADVAALYHVRYAELGSSDVKELTGVDGTAGGTAADPATPSECLDLGSGTKTMLTPAQAKTSNAWHLCFRRASVSVNGENGGPRGVGAVDPLAAQIGSEQLPAVMQKTPESEKASFDAQTFDGATFRGDHIVSAFSEKWLKNGTPDPGVWLIQDSTGTRKYLIGIPKIEGPTAKSPGTVVLRIKPVSG